MNEREQKVWAWLTDLDDEQEKADLAFYGRAGEASGGEVPLPTDVRDRMIDRGQALPHLEGDGYALLRAHLRDILEELITERFKACPHTDLAWEGPDPDVGIFGVALWCDGCGATALEFHEVYEDDPDGTEYPAVGFKVTKWQAPEVHDLVVLAPEVTE
jgi:hypothetical protein